MYANNIRIKLDKDEKTLKRYIIMSIYIHVHELIHIHVFMLIFIL